jgi:hypothetical protein
MRLPVAAARKSAAKQDTKNTEKDTMMPGNMMPTFHTANVLFLKGVCEQLRKFLERLIVQKYWSISGNQKGAVICLSMDEIADLINARSYPEQRLSILLI